MSIIRDEFGGDFKLQCDECGEEAHEWFETFQDAVDFKKDRDNGWRAVKDQYEEWHDLCMSCNCEEIIRKLKGTEP